MKSRVFRQMTVVLVLLAGCGAKCTSQEFPEVRLRPLTLDGVWESAPIVIIGDVHNIQAAGTQKVANLPWPAPHAADLIYWCRGDLRVSAVVKGRSPTTAKQFLWGTAKPGCELFSKQQMQDKQPLSRVWFVREENNYIRPVVDGFGLYYIDLHARWDSNSKLDPQIRFAELLLDPKARGKTLAEFAHGFFAPVSTACLILGRGRCTERLNALAALGDPQLQKAACDFLRSQFGEECAQDSR